MQTHCTCAISKMLVLMTLVVFQTACNKGTSNSESSTSGDANPQTSSSSTTTDSSTSEPTNSGSSTAADTSKSALPLVEKPKQEIVRSASGINLEPVDADGFRATVAKHKGKVVLVDCWATWCGPCTEQFPHTVKLGKDHGAGRLAIISVSFDDPDQPQNVVDFLEKQEAAFDNLIAKSGASVESFVSFEIEGGALPYYKLYDRDGKLRYEFCGDNKGLDKENVLKIEELDAKVAELISEST